MIVSSVFDEKSISFTIRIMYTITYPRTLFHFCSAAKHYAGLFPVRDWRF